MKTVGIIGGIGPESSIEYYRQIFAGYRKQSPNESAPSIILNSIDVQKLLDLVAAKEMRNLTKYLVAEVQRLARAGADFGLLAANTPHIVFDDVQSQSPIPMISIVEATCRATKSLKLKRVGLLGTLFTMQAGFYQRVFTKAGIEIAVPTEDDQTYVHDKYINELLKNTFLPDTREELLAVVNRMIARAQIEGVILGGTELPLILPESLNRNVPFLDTTRIHVESIVSQLLS